MYPELAGKHALVTGATRGFGKAIALNLARQGVKVIVNYRRSMTEANNVVEEIKSFGGEAMAIRADGGKIASLEKLFDKIKEEWGQLEIVVANAAFGVPGNLMEATPKYCSAPHAGGRKER